MDVVSVKVNCFPFLNRKIQGYLLFAKKKKKKSTRKFEAF
jgi:hypothetical protein